MQSILFLLSIWSLAEGICPFGGTGSPPAGHPQVNTVQRTRFPLPGHSRDEYLAALAALDLDAVRNDLKAFFVDSKPSWPADFGNYGPFFVRLAWHCSGSYRTSDGRGGCDGGRQRFDPERSWADNTNLDKARALLWPIKEKYGLGLSWGDLFILAGTTAIQSMGGPILGFCAGRIDDQDGTESLELGPTALQEELFPCPVNGTCKKPLGSTTIGLIYLNPAGPMGQPIPERSALEVRDAFARMALNDSETVALIGGGHAFGKTHGACPNGAGPSPKEDPFNPWPGKCGTGKGKDAYTSGFEGPWTTTPTQWSNSFFKDLLKYEWEVHTGPGGLPQWRIQNATGDLSTIMRLTSDMSLLHDPKGEYQKLVKEFAEDQAKFDDAFAHAWYKLTTRDMGPVTRCVGKDVPPPQPFQFPLPRTPLVLANMTQVKAEIKKITAKPVLPADEFLPFYGSPFVRLAWQCSSTFRVTDWQGGCNGARIRFSPQKDWPANAALDMTLLSLKPIKDLFGDKLSWSDLIIFAAQVVLEDNGAQPMVFCPGRTDAEDGSGSQYLNPKSGLIPSYSNASTIDEFKDMVKTMGLTLREITALNGGSHSLGKPGINSLSNGFFKVLFNEELEQFMSKDGRELYKVAGKELYFLKSDLFFKYDAELRAIAHEYAEDTVFFLREFSEAWTKIVNADRYVGPLGNSCEHSSATTTTTTMNSASILI
eukprot:gnl/MRDRNA2_/MRDRNA2_81039_c0_seq1.p1 gnl/MRDRNA2_/MRDRNA2_81039_c0~~gnl/MRDRNA2_/MRDRNA2_81039_c0_seq1.p1  ORF type:complete len:709 (-),score=130.49 gnl/MRDRNA2_/MRDRNA2_81039_c0_seq1:194-2320(-)